MIDLSRRQAIRIAALSAAGLAMPLAVTSLAHGQSDMPFSHGFSPLGGLAYGPGFAHFQHRNPSAPKGGRLRLGRIGAFDTLDTLRYPGRPPADMRVIYDRLVVGSPEEPSSYYGHLADGIAVSEDMAELTFRLDQSARWHDGTPITSADVEHTFATLKAEGAPFYRQSYRALQLRVEDEHIFTFVNEGRANRDLIGSLASLPIHPAHRPDPPRPDALPLGSGPYRVLEADVPSRLVLERVPNYWAGDAATARGGYNFEAVALRYYRDADVAFEAFRAGEYDARVETNPARWNTAYDGLQTGRQPVRTATVDRPGVGTLHGLVMNVRGGPLADLRVRKALHLSLDANRMIGRLFAGFFQPVGSLFGDTPFAAQGAATVDERALVEGLGGHALASPDPLADMPQPGTRDAALVASRLLDEAGYALDGTQRIDPQTGDPVSLTSLSTNPLYDSAIGEVRLAFARIGIRLDHQALEPSIAARQLLDRQFDIATLSWSPSRLPGMVERLLWHSDLAERTGSYALSGIADPSVDASLDALSAARSPDVAQAAARAFDRALRHSLAFLPLWRDGQIRLAWRDGLEGPVSETLGRSPSFIADWWLDG